MRKGGIAMADEQMGVFQAFWRLITFYGLRKQLGLVRAADRMFTGSTEGIADAFDLHRDQMVRRYEDLFDAFGQLETVLEEKRLESEALAKELKDLGVKRDGALTMYERAQQTGDAEELQKHKAAFERFQGRIKQIEVRQGELTDDVKVQEERMRGFERQLTTLQAEIQNLPGQKAQAMADFVSNQKIIDLNRRLQGVQASIDRGPLDAVMQANRELAAKARVSERLAGTDVRAQDAEYAAAGRSSSVDDDFGAMLAARKAEREAKTGTAPRQAEDVPKI
jgi:chromosome segregation ATPase